MSGSEKKGGRRDGLKGFISKNFGLKMLSLAFAVALWFLVVGEKESELGLLVPLGLKGIPENMIMISEPPNDIEVRVSGPKVFIANLSPSQISATLDLSKAEEGVNTFRVNSSLVKTPRGVSVEKVRPSSVEVAMEMLERKVLPITVELKGVLAEGYVVKEVLVEPSEAVVHVRKGKKSPKRVPTAAIDISAARFTITEEVLIDYSVAGLRGGEPDVARVTVKIEKEEEGDG